MIIGETEAFIENYLGLDNEYDDFFGSKKKRKARRAKRKARRLARRLKRNSSKKVQERRKKRGRFFKDVGDIYRNIGGATAIGGVIDAITMPKNEQVANRQGVSAPTASDYEFSVGNSEDQNKEAENEKKTVPTIAYVIGGVVVLGVVGLAIINYQKNKQLKIGRL